MRAGWTVVGGFASVFLAACGQIAAVSDAGNQADARLADATGPVDAAHADAVDAAPPADGAGAMGCSTGAPPPLEACDATLTSADCGEGAHDGPVLACRHDQCLWFASDCVAEGFVASPCAADNVCCQGSWPFGPSTSRDFTYPLCQMLHAFGTKPWREEIEPRIAVTLDSTLAHGDELFTCTGTPPWPLGNFGENPCHEMARAGVVSFVGGARARFRLARYPSLFYGWNLTVDLDAQAGSAPRLARICGIPYTDFCALQCDADDPVRTVCAVSGSLTLSRLPTAEDPEVAGRLDVRFGDLRLTAEF